MSIKTEIIKLKQQIKLREIANDSYYLSPQYKEDCRTLYQLKLRLSDKPTPTIKPPLS